MSSYELLRQGLDAPICLTWEMTYACNLLCVHCLSSSGRRAPDELTTAEARALLDEWAEMRVFYINVARWIASTEYLDVQISLDGASPEVNDAIRGGGSFSRARRAMALLAEEGFAFKVNHVATRRSFDELDALHGMVTGMGGQLRVTRLRPSGRGRAVWDALKLTQVQNRWLYDWLRAHPDVLTGDSFFHLSALGSPLDGLNMCGAGRIVCCVDPRGDVYACPFVLADEFKAGNVRDSSFAAIWSEAPLFRQLRGWEVGGQCRGCGAYGRCHGGCMAVKHFTGTPLDDPDPECVFAPETGPTATVIPLALSPRPIRP